MSANEPFVYRVGAPCLAALLPLPPKTALWTVNLAASVLLIFLLEAWLRRYVTATMVPWLIAGFAFHWVAPLRQVSWYPTYIDPLGLCAIVAALLVGNRVVPFAIVCFAGALVRETTVIVPLAVLAGAAVRWYRRESFVLSTGAIGVAACLAASVLVRMVVTPATDYWMADAALYWAFEKPAANVVLAVFIAFGPALVLLLVKGASVKRHLADHPEQAAILLIVAMLAWIGGSDTERFLLWSSPIVLVLLGQAAQDIDWARLKVAAGILFLTQMINGRWFLTIPDYWEQAPRPLALLTPLNAQSSGFLFSQNPDRVFNSIVLAEYAVLTLVLLACFTRRRA